tara:strand:- start:580 stop:735 length:156 start_codon:yes stop_codon:yes gene_type:complete
MQRYSPTPSPETIARWKEDGGAVALMLAFGFVLWCLSQPATTVLWWSMVTR